MLKIEGDGSWRRTTVKNGKGDIFYETLKLIINPEECSLYLDGNRIEDSIETIIIKGIYTIIGKGAFGNTRIFIGDEVLRGVQSLELLIDKNNHPLCKIESVLLPNIVESNG